MKFLQRFVANAVAVYLALYLVDSLARGRFLVGGIWVAILAAIVFGFMNSLIRPLPRVRTKTARALIIALLTLIGNAILLQIFSWATPMTAANFSWIPLIAAFLALLTGVLNWLIGFHVPTKGRPIRTARVKEERGRNKIRH